MVDIRDKIIRAENYKAMRADAEAEICRRAAIAGNIERGMIIRFHEAQAAIKRSRFIIACFMPLPNINP